MHGRPRDRNAIGSQLGAAVPEDVVQEALVARLVDKPVEHAIALPWPDSALKAIALRGSRSGACHIGPRRMGRFVWNPVIRRTHTSLRIRIQRMPGLGEHHSRVTPMLRSI